MKAHFLFLGLVSISAILAVPSLCAENLLPNPGFEDGGAPPDGWEFRTKLDSPNTIQMSVADTGHSGNRCVRYDNDATSGYDEGWVYTTRIPVQAGKKYSISYWSKAQAATRIRCEIFWQDNQNEYRGPAEGGDLITEFAGAPLALTHDWRKQERTDIVVPEESEGFPVAKASVFLYGQGGGTIWFDDVYFGRQPETLFPDLNSDNSLDYQDQFPISQQYDPEGLGARDVGYGEMYQLIEERRTRESFVRGVPFRAYYPLDDGAEYTYRSDDPGNNVDYFTQVISAIAGTGDFKVSIRKASDQEAEHSAIVTGSGDFAIKQVIIEKPISADVVTIPAQAVSLSSSLIVGLERVDEDFTQETTASAQLDVTTLEGNVKVPVTVRLNSRITAVGSPVHLGETLGIEVSKTIVVENIMTFITPGGSTGLPTELFYEPGSGIFWFQRDVGMVQLREFTDPNTPGEIFPLRTATIGGRVFP